MRNVILIFFPMCKQSDFHSPRVLTVFESPGVSSKELAKRFQMILGTPRLRPKALSPNSATGPPNHCVRGASHLPHCDVCPMNDGIAGRGRRAARAGAAAPPA